MTKDKVRHCNHCAGRIVLTLREYCVRDGLIFCCVDCADAYFHPDNPEPYPIDVESTEGLM